MIDWENLDDTVRDFHSRKFDLPTVAVYNFQGGYDPATGRSGWTEVHAGDIEAEVTVPTDARMRVGPEGQESIVDRDAFVRDDTGVEFYDVDESTETRPTQIEHDGDRFVVAERINEHNGLLRLMLIEV